MTILRITAVLLALHPATGCSSAQVHPEGGPSNPLGRGVMDDRQVRDRVRSFLSVWLLEGETDEAALFFGDEALRNEALLSAPCAGYVSPGGQSPEASRRAAIDSFLRDFAPPQPRTSLREVLDAELVESLAAELGGKVVNDPRADLFVVARMSKEELPAGESEETDYLRDRLPERFYALFVAVEKGAVYFLWTPQDGTWKIYHASLVCQ